MRADPWSTTKAQAVFESSEINFYSFLHYNCLRLRPHCGGGDWKGSFHSENVWNVFRPTTLEEFENGSSLWKRIECFPSTRRRRNLKTQQSAVILDLCLRKTRSGKSHDYRDAIVFEKTPFSKCFLSTRKRNAGVFKFHRFEERFRNGLVWTVGLTVEIKLCFLILRRSVNGACKQSSLLVQVLGASALLAFNLNF